MIYVNDKLKYMFEQSPVERVVDEEDSNKQYSLDMLVYATFKSDEIEEYLSGNISMSNWSVVHKDGDFDNNSLDNLELVVFKNDKFFKDCKILEAQMNSAKKQAKEKELLYNKIHSENITNKNKITYLTKQISYERNRIKELNKELNKKENEIRRLFDIINKYN